VNQSTMILSGGGGFSDQPNAQLVVQRVLRLCTKDRPKVCFLGTASGDSVSAIDNFYASLKPFDCRTSHLSLFKPIVTNLEKFLLQNHILFVGGGNTRNLLILWREWGIWEIMEKALDKGILIVGTSAGSVCWFESTMSDAFGPRFKKLDCQGILPGSFCPHGQQEDRKKVYLDAIQKNEIPPGYLVEDNVALKFTNKELEEVWRFEEGAEAYWVGRNGISSIPGAEYS
jgi:dipeptidase E